MEIKVFVKLDAYKNIIGVNSSIFLKDPKGWICVDSINDENADRDRYAHAQAQYFEKPLTDQFGNYNYRLINGKIISNTY